ncbi:14660_t:CDS:2, partial [Gigaspora rosea]
MADNKFVSSKEISRVSPPKSVTFKYDSNTDKILISVKENFNIWKLENEIKEILTMITNQNLNYDITVQGINETSVERLNGLIKTVRFVKLPSPTNVTISKLEIYQAQIYAASSCDQIIDSFPEKSKESLPLPIDLKILYNMYDDKTPFHMYCTVDPKVIDNAQEILGSVEVSVENPQVEDKVYIKIQEDKYNIKLCHYQFKENPSLPWSYDEKILETSKDSEDSVTSKFVSFTHLDHVQNGSGLVVWDFDSQDYNYHYENS